MSARSLPSAPAGDDPDALYRYVRELNGRLLRAQKQLDKRRKQLREAEELHANIARHLRLALRATQAPLPAIPEVPDQAEPEQGGLNV